MKLTQLVPEGAVVARLASNRRDLVIAELLDGVLSTGAADASLKPELLTRVLERESRGSTGFGKGIAVPHVKHKQVKRMTAGIGLHPDGIDFNSLDKQPVYTVFLLLSPEDRPEEHLQAMEAIFKNLSNEAFRRLLRQAGSADEVAAVLEQADGH